MPSKQAMPSKDDPKTRGASPVTAITPVSADATSTPAKAGPVTAAVAKSGPPKLASRADAPASAPKTAAGTAATTVAKVVEQPSRAAKPVIPAGSAAKGAARPDVVRPDVLPPRTATEPAVQTAKPASTPSAVRSLPAAATVTKAPAPTLAEPKTTPAKVEPKASEHKPSEHKVSGGSKANPVKTARPTAPPAAKAVPPTPASTPGAAALVPASAALAEPLRALADTGLNQARDTFATIKTTTDRLTSGVDESTRATANGFQAFSSSLLNAMQANIDAAFGFVKAMTSARSLSDVVELQSRHARAQFEAVTAQAKELSGIVNRTATAANEPVRKALDETFRKAS
jgi:phasin